MTAFRILLLLVSVSYLGNVLGKDAKPKVYSLHIQSDIRYRYATTLVTSRVVNPANVSQEVTFNVVLPETAFITEFVMVINEKEYWAYVREKEDAKKEYEQALESGLSAAHVSYNARDSNNFDVSVNIEPMNKVTFNLTYEEFLERKLSTYTHEININPGQIVPDMSVEVNILDASPIVNLKVPDFRISNEIVVDEKDNPNARIEKPSPEKATIKWTLTEEEQIEMNKEGIKGQLAVKYDVDRSKNSQLILVDEGYFVHFYSDDELEPLNKHVIFVLDLSGSMYGRKLQQVKDAMNQILTELKPKDYFSLVFFSDRSKAWVPNKPFSLSYSTRNEPEQELSADYVVPATVENIETAKNLIQNLTDLGATNIIAGLRKGLKLSTIGKDLFRDSKDGLEPLVIFLTDGQPNVEMSNPEEITKAATKLNTNRSPIFSLGFGDGADLDFLKKLSLANSGFARTIYEASDAALQLKLFYSQVASPLLSNVTFNYVREQVGNETTNVHFDTLFSGGELVVAGELTSDIIGGALMAHSSNGMKEINFNDIKVIRIRDFIPPVPEEKNRTFGHLERMWAYKTIKQLLDKETVTKDDKLKQKALELALKYSFVTPVTSLVVVKPNKTSTVDAEKAPANHGFGGLSYPAVASGLYYPPLQFAPAFGTNTVFFQSPLRGSGLPNRVSSMSKFSKGYSRLPLNTSRRGKLRKISRSRSRNKPAGVKQALSAGSNSLLMVGPPGPRPAPQAPATMSGAFGGGFRPTSTMPAMLPDVNSFEQDANLEAGYSLISYTDIAWLNQTSSEDDTHLLPPQNVSTDLISLNATDVAFFECSVHGEQGQCRHFIHCALDAFQLDESVFDNFKCHIDPNYLGVCCPVSLKPVQGTKN